MVERRGEKVRGPAGNPVSCRSREGEKKIMNPYTAGSTQEAGERVRQKWEKNYREKNRV